MMPIRLSLISERLSCFWMILSKSPHSSLTYQFNVPFLNRSYLQWHRLWNEFDIPLDLWSKENKIFDKSFECEHRSELQSPYNRAILEWTQRMASLSKKSRERERERKKETDKKMQK
jgi:hypothetical protein